MARTILCFPRLKPALAALALLAAWSVWTPAAPAADQGSYVGTESCKECHDEQYARFQKYSKKANSFQSVQSMRKGLAEDEYRGCFECHTTGYNRPGGFRSETETPALKNAGCEVCHGPGGNHVASQDPKDIRRRPDLKMCESCHNAERVGVFRYRPLMYGGAH